MTRVKIKCKGLGSSGNKDKKIKLLEIMCTKEIHVTKIFNTNDGFALLLISEDNAEKIFTKELKDSLDKEGFYPLKVKKSIIVTRVEDLIYDRYEDEIAEELKLKNLWIGDEIDSVFKFPNSSTIKIIFTQTNLAKKSIEKGLLAFNLNIPPSDIKQETFIQIKTCMKYYRIEDHSTRDCPKDVSFRICSECSKEGHVWHQCKEQIKKCINCGENHTALAIKCVKRKTVIRKKRKEEATRKNLSFAAATSSRNNFQQQPHLVDTPNITKEDTLKIQMCFVHAYYRNIENPGSYEDELNKILKINNLPSIKIPETPNSHKILSLQSQQQTQNTIGTIQKKQYTQKTKEVAAKHDRYNEEKDDEIDSELESMEKEILCKDAREIGLKIFTSKERGWPSDRFTTTDLLQGTEHNRYKWSYKDAKYSEEEILEMI